MEEGQRAMDQAIIPNAFDLMPKKEKRKSTPPNSLDKKGKTIQRHLPGIERRLTSIGPQSGRTVTSVFGSTQL